MLVTSLDHLVLTVRDIRTTCQFYERVLGMTAVTFGAGRKALQFGSQKINLHQIGQEIEPHAAVPTPGSADLCFVAGVSTSELLTHLKREQIPILKGPVPRAGAIGPITSIYLRDPDENLLEISTY
ncbi:VOC family protein [Schlesneria paludicola]|uniref:VOC family protein n=1 Tax=Schlesneria paludicola TaxID=360056 RepID=UPI000299E06E|nr:VOC family protein [Schlesneria paludicola]